MKKLAVLMLVVISATLTSVALAGDRGENMVGNLFLFQKCDPSLIPDVAAENPQFDSNGCPLPGNGPWPILSENRRWGQMRYNLLGEIFRFSFQGKRLLPETDYTLIYYPDQWPGKGLICLGSNMSNPNGNLHIAGNLEILSGLPAPYDNNFNPVEPSGAVGAKIWLVPAADVQCEAVGEIDPETGLPAEPTQMLAWNPASYLFEANMIVYQYIAQVIDPEVDDEDDDANLVRKPSHKNMASDPKNNGNTGNNGKGKNR